MAWSKLGPPDPDLPYKDAWKAYRASPGPEAADAYLKVIRPTIDQGLGAFGGGSVGPSLKSHAKRIALDAANTYDPERGPLRKHLLNHLQGLRRPAMRQSRVLSVPDAVMIDNKAVMDGTKQLADRLGRDPADSEIADYTGLSIKRIGKVRTYRPGLATGQYAAMATGRGDDMDEGGPDDPAVERADPIGERLSLVMEDLDPLDRAILENHFALNGRTKVPASHLARRLNLSPGALSQRSAKLQTMLDELADAGLL